MPMKKRSTVIFKTAAVLIIIISLVLNFLQTPFYNKYAVPAGQGYVQYPRISLSVIIFLIRQILLAVYIIMYDNKKAKKHYWIFSLSLSFTIFSLFLSLCSNVYALTLISNIAAARDHILSLYLSDIIMSVMYILFFIFLLVDSIRKHRFLTASRCVISVYFMNSIRPIINYFLNNHALYALSLCSGYFYTVALLIYYFAIATNKTDSLPPNDNISSEIPQSENA